MYNGKYLRLYEYLKKKEKELSQYTLTFNEMEHILQFNLPVSAYKYSAWWANEIDGMHTQARSWMLAGWKTSDVIVGKKITFKK